MKTFFNLKFQKTQSILTREAKPLVLSFETYHRRYQQRTGTSRLSDAVEREKKTKKSFDVRFDQENRRQYERIKRQFKAKQIKQHRSDRKQ